MSEQSIITLVVCALSLVMVPVVYALIKIGMHRVPDLERRAGESEKEIDANAKKFENALATAEKVWNARFIAFEAEIAKKVDTEATHRETVRTELHSLAVEFAKLDTKLTLYFEAGGFYMKRDPDGKRD
jgi:hypothetical protein